MVSVIIVNYNGSEVISGCLEALGRQTFGDYEILIIDNDSTDGSLSLIREVLKEISLEGRAKVIPLDANLGFTGGNACGLSHATGSYIALLNADTEPDRVWLEELVGAAERDPSAGVCASKLIVYNSTIIDSAGDGYSFALKGFKRGEGRDAREFGEKEYVFGACAGGALYRRAMIEEIGFLDEDFFLIYEDTDLSFRAQLAGWKVLYVPTALLYHKVRSTIGTMSRVAVYYSMRNAEFVRIKNVPFPVFVASLPQFLLGAVMEFIYVGLKHGDCLLYLKAKRDAVLMLPRMLRKRTRIMRSRKVDNRYVLSIMTPLFERKFVRSKLGKLFRG
jgi:GT2 family glycosyltransferase